MSLLPQIKICLLFPDPQTCLCFSRCLKFKLLCSVEINTLLLFPQTCGRASFLLFAIGYSYIMCLLSYVTSILGLFLSETIDLGISSSFGYDICLLQLKSIHQYMTLQLSD